MRISSLLGFAAMLAIVFSACSKQKTTDNWKVFTSQEGDFSVLAPGVPVEKTENSNLRVLHKFFFQTGETNSAYSVVYGDVPKDKRNINQIYDDVRNTVVGKYGRLLQEKPITISGFSGREIKVEIDNGDGFVVERFFLGKERFYQELVVGPKQEQSSTNIENFLNSFSLLDAK
jgi:hypothetical protein